MADVHGSPGSAPQMPQASTPGPSPAPYHAGEISPVYTGGDTDAGGRDDVSGTVEGAIAAAMGRQAELAADTHGQGSVIGDLMTLPEVPEDSNRPANDFLYAQGDQPGT